MKYWVNTISKDHVQTGLEGGFTQVDHGKGTRLKNLSNGDGLLFYSPRSAIADGQSLQAFTAIGKVLADEAYQVELSSRFQPWRKSVTFFSCHKETPIRPLLNDLSFIVNKKRWGFPFRRGLFEIPESDFMLIAGAMDATAFFEKQTCECLLIFESNLFSRVIIQRISNKE